MNQQPNEKPSNPQISRRNFTLGSAAAAASAVAMSQSAAAQDNPQQSAAGQTVTGPAGQQGTRPKGNNESVDASSGRLKQSFCRWCFSKQSLEELCQWATKLGLVGIDLLGPDDFETIKKHNLICTMVNSHPLTDGLCDPKFHEMALQKMNDAIEATAKEGWRNVICFSGNARGIDRETGLKNCAEALKKITPVAEKHNVILNMELLNSRVNHPDYMCDRSDWGIELCKRVGSDNFKLLYDIYHMQIMEGDIIRSIQDNHQYFGHYHTAGNPGRHELDESQELFYPAIARAVAETPFDGFFVHEFIPSRDAFAGLTDAVRQCVV